MENPFEEETTSWSLAHQLHLVQSLAYWPWWQSIKRGSRCSDAIKLERIQKRKDQLGWKDLVFSWDLSMIMFKRIWKVYQKYPNMLFALTWCHCTPTDTPTSPSTSEISNEHQVDAAACASNVGRNGGAAALLHQGCSIVVRDCQVVIATVGMIFDVKCSEL